MHFTASLESKEFTVTVRLEAPALDPPPPASFCVEISPLPQDAAERLAVLRDVQRQLAATREVSVYLCLEGQRGDRGSHLLAQRLQEAARIIAASLKELEDYGALGARSHLRVAHGSDDR